MEQFVKMVDLIDVKKKKKKRARKLEERKNTGKECWESYYSSLPDPCPCVKVLGMFIVQKKPVKTVKMQIPEGGGEGGDNSGSKKVRSIWRKTACLSFKTYNYVIYICRRKIWKDIYQTLKVLFSGRWNYA